MKILITGAKGQLGKILTQKYSMDTDIYSFGSAELDITNQKKVSSILREIRPTTIINCASYTQVDQAEIMQGEVQRINEMGVKNLATACSEIDAKLVQISTDYIFDGAKGVPYIETDTPNPLNVYGKTKWIGEQIVEEICEQHLIIRTAWLYSYEENNFVNTICKLAKERHSLSVVDDQIGTPTNAYELANVIQMLVNEKAHGRYHCSGKGMCSWYEFAKRIVKLYNIPCEIEKISSSDYKQKAKRPKYSVLDNYALRHTLGDPMRYWEDALERHVKQITI